MYKEITKKELLEEFDKMINSLNDTNYDERVYKKGIYYAKGWIMSVLENKYRDTTYLIIDLKGKYNE